MRLRVLPTLLVVLVLADVAIGSKVIADRLHRVGRPAPAAVASAGAAEQEAVSYRTTTVAPPTRRPPPPVSYPPSPPSRIAIPAIDVSSAVTPLGLNDDGTLQVPTSYAQAGWWDGGPTPGDQGPAVIVGHVDSHSDPAVFFRLRDLKPGNAVWVSRQDGSSVRFVVQRIAEVPKADFPSRQVYGAVSYPALRLITCGGKFDRSSGHYRDNIIVFARGA